MIIGESKLTNGVSVFHWVGEDHDGQCTGEHEVWVQLPKRCDVSVYEGTDIREAIRFFFADYDTDGNMID